MLVTCNNCGKRIDIGKVDLSHQGILLKNEKISPVFGYILFPYLCKSCLEKENVK